MRPIERGPCPLDSSGKKVVFQEYAHARPKLLANLGEYCSYCEIQLSYLATEHIRHKNHNPKLEREWSNFLLACPSCNSTKGTKIDTQADVDDRLWPHLHRTFDAFDYGPGGVVRVRTTGDPRFVARAKATAAMVGLCKRPGSGLTAEQVLRGSDPRWKKRWDVWKTATDMREDLRESDSLKLREFALKCARLSGFWSVWMTVFGDDEQMRLALCRPDVFPGTAPKRVFSASGSEPMARPLTSG